MADFAQIPTQYIPDYALGGVMGGINARRVEDLQAQRIQDLQEEAMRKAAMHPLELENIQSSIDFKRAQAEQMLRDKADTNVQRQAQAEQIRINQSLLEDIAALQGFGSRYGTKTTKGESGKLSPQDLGASQFGSIYDNLKTPVLKKMFQAGEGWQYSPELIQQAIDFGRGIHPELSKVMREDMRGGYGMQKQELVGEQQKERLGMSLRAKKELQDAKIQGDLSKVGNDPLKLAGEYQRIAEELERAGNTEEADIYFAMARRASLLKAMSVPSAGQQKVDMSAAGVQTTTPVGATANQPQRTVKIKRDAAGNLVRE